MLPRLGLLWSLSSNDTQSKCHPSDPLYVSPWGYHLVTSNAHSVERGGGNRAGQGPTTKLKSRWRWHRHFHHHLSVSSFFTVPSAGIWMLLLPALLLPLPQQYATWYFQGGYEWTVSIPLGILAHVQAAFHKTQGDSWVILQDLCFLYCFILRRASFTHDTLVNSLDSSTIFVCFHLILLRKPSVEMSTDMSVGNLSAHHSFLGVKRSQVVANPHNQCCFHILLISKPKPILFNAGLKNFGYEFRHHSTIEKKRDFILAYSSIFLSQFLIFAGTLMIECGMNWLASKSGNHFASQRGDIYFSTWSVFSTNILFFFSFLFFLPLHFLGQAWRPHFC